MREDYLRNHGGAQTYLVYFSYDSQGRKTKMTTFRHISDSGEMPAIQTGDKTLWTYAPHTGNVTEKFYRKQEGKARNGMFFRLPRLRAGAVICFPWFVIWLNDGGELHCQAAKE